MMSLALRAVNQNWIHSEWVLNISLMDMNTLTTHWYEQYEAQRYSLLCVS